VWQGRLCLRDPKALHLWFLTWDFVIGLEKPAGVALRVVFVCCGQF
jgi:hypothetical protein